MRQRVVGCIMRSLVFLLLLVVTTLDAQTKKPPARASLTDVWVIENVRIWYTTHGEHAVTSTDANRNVTPDQVEDIMTQTRAALQLWKSLGFPDPFATARYHGVSWLDIHLLNKETLKTNGVAFDEIQRFQRPEDPAGTMSLCFNVATSVNAAENLTPAHEVFHLIQNSVCYFKNRWFTEGTARWSERALGAGGLPTGLKPSVWPPDESALKAIYAGAYETALSYWSPLLTMHDESGTLPKEKLPPALLTATYVNGQPVMKDLELSGWELIRDILLALDQADDTVYRDRQLTRWSEEEQFSAANNPIIHQVVKQVAAAASSTPR